MSDREATEIVYLTALCRGMGKSLDEFNAEFVPKGETFLFPLPAVSVRLGAFYGIILT